MPEPILKPVKAIAHGVSINGEVEELLTRLKYVGNGVFILKDEQQGDLINPSMINDECPVASALRIRHGGVIVRRPSDLRSIALSNVIHEAYSGVVGEWNKGWVTRVSFRLSRVIKYSGLELRVVLEPDILLGIGGEWHLIEVEAGKLRRSHEAQLALYWHLLKDEFNIVKAWLITINATIPYSTRDLNSIINGGLGYLASVRRVLDSWGSNGPGMIIQGKCPCRWAPLCPVWGRYLTEGYLKPN